MEKFERVYISYALSMIPPWREAVARAADVVADGGKLMVVDFGDCGGLPGVFRAALGVWLSWFGVHPREKLEADLSTCARQSGFQLSFRPLYRGYAFLGALTNTRH